MRGIKQVMIGCWVVVAGGTMSLAHAVGSDSGLMQPMQMVAQKQQPVTVADTAVKPALVDPSRGGGLSCPTGYALTSIQAAAETKTTVTVFTECNGAGAYYVHTWCQNAPKYYDAVKKAPVTTYTCQKIENKWVPA